MVDLNKLSKTALSAAMRGGTATWGSLAIEDNYIRYAEPVPKSARRRCHCGCKTRATKIGMCNGIALRHGCDVSIMRWVKECKVSKK